MNKDEKEKKKHGGLKRVLNTLGDVGGEILGAVGKVTGIKAFDVAADLVSKDDRLTDKEKEVAMKELMKEKELALEYYKIDAEDRGSAREMRVKTNESKAATQFNKIFPDVLAAFIVLAAVTFGIMLFYVEIPEGNKRTVELFCDVFLFGGAFTVIQFFFGSSKGSKDKDNKVESTLRP